MIIEYVRTVTMPTNLAGRPPARREIERVFGLQLIAEGYATLVEDDPPDEDDTPLE